MALTARVEAWRAGGEIVEIGHRRIFVHRTEADGSGDGGRPPVVLLHGFPSSSYDWRGVIAALPDRRTLAFDFLGFGLSDKPRDATYSLLSQADLVEAVVDRYLDGPVTLVAHDMGTSVTTELLARDLDDALSLELGSVLLFNGSMVIEKAHLTRSQRILRGPLGPVLARVSSSVAFRQEFQRLFSAGHPLSRAEADDQWALLAHDGGNRILDRLIHYLGERTTYAERWHGALRDWKGDLRLAWGLDDPVAVIDVLEAVRDLRPDAPVTRWSGRGHYPQIEDPAAVAALIREL
ncbi:MAG: alpha/beta fold hydrolase [Jatrophihabitans sp.]|uniref:alpha/beta fold hydrolase n=1 Tax=Jatrophihabitans sp. TaxID=1932789 RepID=UPI003F805E37